jgi:hypothetical protein
MNRLSLWLSVLLLVALAASGIAGAAKSDYPSAVAALAAVDPTLAPPSNDPQRDFVVGGFEDVFGEKVGVSAHSDPLNEEPFGHESVTLPQEYKIRSRIICLAVDGNLAAWGTSTTHAGSNSDPPGTEFVEVGKDGGPGGSKDRWNFFVAQAQDCADFLGQAGNAPLIVSGNILINDARS